ncbi:embryonic protein UVS.2-like [Spea bombifrons]|uniref:embryonic protein UVS.2-like n=1 Tax=Spea bombifrons TaxID=233779 RepID=UPI00234B8418|nr:embryonic protein UVS.2-like [Spea bombifrons]
MNMRIALLLLPYLFQFGMGASLQIHFESLGKPEIVKEPPKETDVFTVIEAANKDSKMVRIEGDIAVNIGRSAMKCDQDSCRWKKNTSGKVNVPYTISPDFSADEVDVITTAMQDFATLTCVQFIPRSSEPDFVQIISDSGCWSYVGRIGGRQDLSLAKTDCMRRGTIQHELNHALGFFHEQSRSDRDNYIDVITENIMPGFYENFNKYDTNNLGLEYDYGSVMHYGRSAFSLRPGQADTIVPKPNKTVTIGQRYGLSNLDISKINKLYQCDVCSTLLPDSTGSLISTNYPSNYPNNAKCYWLIRTPSDKVFLQFSAFDVQRSADCTSDYFKVYDGANTSSPVLLDRACGAGQVPSLVSSASMMLLEFVSDRQTTATGFKATYSTVNCGSTLTSSSGVFSSPNYPLNYKIFSECTWVILAPVGFKVSLTMTDFNVERQRTCSYDYVLVFDGPKPTSPQKGKYCGQVNVPPIESSGNSLLVQFHSDGSVVAKGFLANYAFIPL